MSFPLCSAFFKDIILNGVFKHLKNAMQCGKHMHKECVMAATLNERNHIIPWHPLGRLTNKSAGTVMAYAAGPEWR